MVSLPALAHPWTRRISGVDSIAIGHFGTAGYIAAGAVGRLVDPRGRSRSTENIKVPESLRFLRDSMVATALSMVLKIGRASCRERVWISWGGGALRNTM